MLTTTQDGRLSEARRLQSVIDALKGDYPETCVWGVRWDEQEFPVGHLFADSRVWDDNEPTEETLNGTCAIRDGHLLRALRTTCYYGRPYVVCGRLSTYGQDEGEVVLCECEVMALP
jgi:hypothetical protein